MLGEPAAGKHTFVEKPMPRWQDILGVGRESSGNLTLMVGHTFLYSSAIRRIKAIIDNGDIGDIRYQCAALNLGFSRRTSM
jgi:predicted dehydrogenase